MEYLPGLPPNSPAVQNLSSEERDRIIDIGAAAIIRMLYRDGFFHADLHPGNLLVLPGPKAGFIDLGMVGRFDDDLRRTLLYYFYCLVMGDRRERSSLFGIHRGGRSKERPEGLPPRCRGDLPQMAAGLDFRGLFHCPADHEVRRPGR